MARRDAEVAIDNAVKAFDTYFGLGGFHMNLNVISKEALEDAMEHPEKYPQLTVRVSGYAVNFVRLTREQQLDVINRTFHASYCATSEERMMSEDGMVEAGSRFDLRTGKSPDAPETASFEGTEATFGWVHSYETGSTVDGPGVRLMLFMSGCLLRCLYCHNPDTWHIKDGTRIELAQAIRRLGDFAPALRSCGASPSRVASRWCRSASPAVCSPRPGSSACTRRSTPPASLATALMTPTLRASILYCSTSRVAIRTYRKVTGCELHPTCALRRAPE